jgi:hypothetical protein
MHQSISHAITFSRTAQRATTTTMSRAAIVTGEGQA